MNKYAAAAHEIKSFRNALTGDLIVLHDIFRCQSHYFADDLKELMSREGRGADQESPVWMDQAYRVLTSIAGFLGDEKRSSIPLKKLLPEYWDFKPRKVSVQYETAGEYAAALKDLAKTAQRLAGMGQPNPLAWPARKAPRARFG